MDQSPITPDLLQQLTHFARIAGERAMPFYRAAVAVKEKEDRSPLTEADMASHHYLSEVLPALLPLTPVISEESVPGASLEGAAQFWLVDPLDGTKEFLKGTDEFTVNIALIKDNSPVAGVVHAPALGVTYYAAANQGAWRLSARQPLARIKVRAANPVAPAIVASKDRVCAQCATFEPPL